MLTAFARTVEVRAEMLIHRAAPRLMAVRRRMHDKPIGVYVLVLGMLMTLGFAPFFLWPVALASIAGLFWLVDRARNRRQAAATALVWGMGHQLTALYWLPRAFYQDAGGDWVAGIAGGVPALLAVALYGALGMVLLAVLVRSLPVQVWGRRWLRPLAFVAGWVTLDMVKALTPYGFPWLPAGAIWGGDFLGVPLMAQLASVGGVFLLSALVLTVAVLLAGGGVRRATAAAGILVAVAAFGAARLTMAPDLRGRDADVPLVRMAQPNIQSAHKWDEARRMAYLRETMNAAFEPARDGRVPDVVVLPETAVAFTMDSDPDLRRQMTRFMQPGQTLLTGTIRRDNDPLTGQATFANSFAAMAANGTMLGSYDKRLLVPFGEFIPARHLLDTVTPYLPFAANIRTLSQSRLDFAFGKLDPRLPTPVGVVESLICYEGIFPWFVARHSAGTDWLVNITNDNWFTGTTALFQHATLARLRAIETGLPLIRVANTGLTIAYDGWGREAGRLPINQAVKLDLPLPPRSPQQTLFARFVSNL